MNKSVNLYLFEVEMNPDVMLVRYLSYYLSYYKY